MLDVNSPPSTLLTHPSPCRSPPFPAPVFGRVYPTSCPPSPLCAEGMGGVERNPCQKPAGVCPDLENAHLQAALWKAGRSLQLTRRRKKQKELTTGRM